jgi:N-acetylglucosamine-6-phosphate deacetylase
LNFHIDTRSHFVDSEASYWTAFFCLPSFGFLFFPVGIQTTMSSAIHNELTMPTADDRITKFTNCRLLEGDGLIEQDLLINATTGKIIRGQEAFYDQHKAPDTVVNLGGRIVAPGFIDVQLNGAVGFDFSVLPDDMADYSAGVQRVNKALVQTGVTSYLPTLTSQRSEVYRKVA